MRHHRANTLAAVRQKGENQDRQRRCRNAAASQAGRDLPVDVAPAVVCNRAASFGQGGVEQIGADRRGRVYAKQQDQQRGHQRAAADAGQADDGTDGKAGKSVEVSIHGRASYAGWIESKRIMR